MKIRYILLYFLLFFNLCFSQQNLSLLDEFENKNSNKEEDTLSASIYLKTAILFSKNENDSAFYYFSKAIEIAESNNSNISKSNVFYETGKAFEKNHDYKNAIDNYLKSASYYNLLEDKNMLAKLYGSIGDTYMKLLNETKAIEYYLKSLKIYRNDLNDISGIASNYIAIGNLYFEQQNYEYATSYYKDALAYYEELDDKTGIAISYTNLGNATADSGDNIEGLKYFFKAVEIDKSLKRKTGLAIDYNNIGDCYINLKQYKEAQIYFEKALNIAEEINDKGFLSLIYLNIADIHNIQNNHDLTIVNALKSISYANQIGSLVYEIDDLKYLANAYEGKGDEKKAIYYLKAYTQRKDSMASLDRIKKVQLFQALNELEKTRYTIDELSNKNEISKIKYENEKKISYVLIVAIVVFAVLVIILNLLHTSKQKANNLLKFRNYQIHRMNEEMQEQRDNLKLSNATKDKFFSIIAHDLKNPFNSIQGFTQLLIENYENYDTRKRLKFLKIIKGSAVKASNLLDNLLLWANNQSGNISYVPEKIELVQQISETVLLLEIQAFNKEITVTYDVNSGVFVDADKNMLNTILRNLISNAIKFTNTKGKIIINSIVKNNFVEISIEDNGIGMTNVDRNNLFNIDVKTSNIGTANEHGSGFGLVLCKDFIEKHGGIIKVESELNKGSKFTFTIPLFKDNSVV